MRWMALVALASLAACAFDETGLLGSDGRVDPIDAARSGDAPPASDAANGDASRYDAAPPPADAVPPDAYLCTPWDWSPTNFDPCDTDLPAPGPQFDPNILGSWTLDSDTGEVSPPSGPSYVITSALLSQASGPDIRVIPVIGFDVGFGASLEIVGSHPVVFAVYGEALVSGTVDASGRTPLAGDSLPGPGADLACNPASPGEDATNASSGGGGGGGGGYGEDGGAGGDGQGSGKGAKGAKGAKSGNLEISPLRGGCSGGGGGNAFEALAGIGGAGGAGGGAVQISARDSLFVSGVMRSVGIGGRSGGTGLLGAHSGAGGAGSGGAILLESDSITVTSTASACANGGSGGEGAGASISGGQGVAGSCSTSDGASTLNFLSDGGDGGDGSYADHPAGSAATNGSSGGGGGGGGAGVGRIRIRGVSTRDVAGGATITPAPAS